MTGRYRTIVADPPWPQRNSPVWIRPTRDGRPGGIAEQGLPYQTMPLDEIRRLPVGELAHADANVFVWATNTTLRYALTLADEWGFRYAQTLVWRKTNASPFAGTGSFAVLDVEFVVVARRGVARFSGRCESSVFTARRSDTNSAKPDSFLDMVEEVSPGPYLELFARRQRLGWDTWGDEALNHVELSA